MNSAQNGGGAVNPLGLYLHIPFCDGKCPYCDFYSVCDRSDADAYTLALCSEMERAADGRKTADTLYLGGGTPPLLGGDNLVRLIETARNCFSFAGEATLEANPGSVDFKLLEQLRKAGYSRISFGMQSAVPQELAALGRRHTPQQAKQAVFLAKAAGFTNISADLMLGIPYQTRESLRQSLDFIAELEFSHLSAYLLKIEEGTPFAESKISVLCPEEDVVCDLYLDTVQALKEQGLAQYEISNFAKPGMECRHNLKYWRCEEYLGFGPAAHGYHAGRRYGHSRDLTSYLSAPESTVFQTEETPGSFAEYAMLRLRLTEGITLADVKERFGIDPETLRKRALPLEKHGLLTVRDGRIALTPRGFLVSNEIIARLVF